MKRAVLLVAIASILAVGGCKRGASSSSDAGSATKALTLDDVVAEHKTRVQAKIDAALKIGASLPKPTTHDAVKVDKGPIHLLAADTAKFAGGADASAIAPNATIMDADDLRGDLTTRTPPTFGQGEKMLIDCAAMLHKKPVVSTGFVPTSYPTEVRRVLTQCENFTYLLVVRIGSQKEPEVNETARTFQAGHVDGDVLVYDLDTGKQLGGYKFSAKNPSHMDLDVNDARHGLEKDLRDKMWAAIRDGFEKLVPGSNVITVY